MYTNNFFHVEDLKIPQIIFWYELRVNAAFLQQM